MRDFNRSRNEKIELQLDNKQIVSFVIGSLVVLGVVFALGVMVGKQLAVGGGDGQVAPSDPLAAIDARQQALVDATDGGAPAPGQEGEPQAQAPKADQPLTFAQELTRPKAVDPVIEPTRAATPEPKPQPKREEPVAEPEKKVEPAAAASEGPTSRTGLAAAFEKASGKPASGGEGAFALQVASLPTRGDAEKVVQQLASKGYQAYVVPADIPGKGQYFRVKVGSYATREEASRAIAGVKQKTSMSAIVTSAH